MATIPKAQEMMSLRTAPTRFVKDLAQIDWSCGLRHRTARTIAVSNTFPLKAELLKAQTED